MNERNTLLHVVWRENSYTVVFILSIRVTDRNDMSNEDPCLHFEAKLVPDLRTKIKKRLIAAICDLKQPCDMIEIYKHFNSHDQNVIPTSFQSKERVSRKHKFQLYYKRPRDGVRGIEHNSFYFRTSKLWNNLPSKAVHADTKNILKNRLDVFWKDEPIMYDHTASIFRAIHRG